MPSIDMKFYGVLDKRGLAWLKSAGTTPERRHGTGWHRDSVVPTGFTGGQCDGWHPHLVLLQGEDAGYTQTSGTHTGQRCGVTKKPLHLAPHCGIAVHVHTCTPKHQPPLVWPIDHEESLTVAPALARAEARRRDPKSRDSRPPLRQHSPTSCITDITILFKKCQKKLHSTELRGGAPTPFVIHLQLFSLTHILGHRLQRLPVAA